VTVQAPPPFPKHAALLQTLHGSRHHKVVDSSPVPVRRIASEAPIDLRPNLGLVVLSYSLLQPPLVPEHLNAAPNVGHGLSSEPVPPLLHRYALPSPLLDSPIPVCLERTEALVQRHAVLMATDSLLLSP